MQYETKSVMGKYQVFHCPKELFREVCCTRGPKLVEFVQQHRQDYEHVADVVTDDIARVFTATNTIAHGWWENEDVTVRFEGEGCRSTSVGDVVVFPDGKAHVVDSFGYTELVS